MHLLEKALFSCVFVDLNNFPVLQALIDTGFVFFIVPVYTLQKLRTYSKVYSFDGETFEVSRIANAR